MPSNVALHQPFQHSGARAVAAHASREEIPEIEVTGRRPDAAEGAGEGKGMSFWDLLDVINPLQHIPVVNRVYRAVTGDEIGTPAKIAGGALFFGVAGLAVAAADSAVENVTGKDMMGNAMSMVGLGDDEEGEAGQTPAGALAGSAGPAPQAGAPRAGAQQTEAMPSPAELEALARERRIKELSATPGASAAVAALSGLPPSAAVGTLPSPGAAGMDAMAMAALEQQSAAATEPSQGLGLSKYRQLAVGGTPARMPNHVPSGPEQVIRSDRGQRAVPQAAAASPAIAMPQTALQDAALDLATRTGGDAATAGKPAAEAPAGATAGPAGAAWPQGGATPLPPALVADMMSQALNKYEAMAKARKSAPAPATVNGNY